MRRAQGLVLAALASAVLAASALAVEAPVPAAGPRAPDEVEERLLRGADLTLPEVFRAGGALSYAMLLLSIGVVAGCAYCLIECRPGRVLPSARHAEVMARLAAGDRAEAARALEEDTTLYGSAARAALVADRPTREDLHAVMRASGERDAALLRGKVGALAGVGAVAAMLGMAGAVLGMLQAFAASASEVYEPIVAYAAVAKALVSAFLGLAIAAVAVAGHLVLRFGLERSLARAGFALEEVVSGIAWSASRRGGPDSGRANPHPAPEAGRGEVPA